MEIKNWPNNIDEYVGAGDVMAFLHGKTSGVYAADNNAAVTAAGGMVVNVSDGYGWLADANENGCVWWNDAGKNGTPMALTLAAAGTSKDRIDRVIVSWNTTGYINRPEIKILKGTESTTPEPPALTNNTVTRQISLARIRVRAGALAVTAADITDERLDSSVCGLVSAGVQIPMEPINALIRQIEDELNAIHSGSGFELKSLVYSNISVTPSMVVSTTDSEIAHPYTLKIPVSGATTLYYPEVLFSDAQAMSGNWGGFAKTIDGYVLVGADAVPQSSFVIPAVVLRRY